MWAYPPRPKCIELTLFALAELFGKGSESFAVDQSPPVPFDENGQQAVEAIFAHELREGQQEQRRSAVDDRPVLTARICCNRPADGNLRPSDSVPVLLKLPVGIATVTMDLPEVEPEGVLGQGFVDPWLHSLICADDTVEPLVCNLVCHGAFENETARGFIRSNRRIVQPGCHEDDSRELDSQGSQRSADDGKGSEWVGAETS